MMTVSKVIKNVKTLKEPMKADKEAKNKNFKISVRKIDQILSQNLTVIRIVKVPKPKIYVTMSKSAVEAYYGSKNGKI